MPQVGIDPLGQIHAFYEASALPPSNHGWILHGLILDKIIVTKRYNF